jgi:hypothetical protein
MSELAKLQAAFQRALLTHDRTALTQWVAEDDQQRLGSRLDIYEHAYRSRLQAALESNYPLFAQWLGTQTFTLVAQDFIDAHPSRHFSIRTFGESLPQALAHSFEHRPEIVEFARWEWTLGTCFDAPDVDPVVERALTQFSAHQWPALRFELHPAVTFFTAHTNAPQIYRALGEDRVPPDPEMTVPRHWIIWRRDHVPRYRALDIAEHAALQALQAGATFEMLCTIISEHDAQNTATRAATLLREWLDARLLCNVRAVSA